MSKMTPEYLRLVQGQGWNIMAVDQGSVSAGCPRADCGLTIKLAVGAHVPASCRSQPALAEVVVDQYDDARRAMRDRRQQLGLSIKDVEEAGGIAVDFLAKFEKDDPSKIPNVQTFLEWVQSLGYAVVLRPAALPPYTARIIAETRANLAQRKRAYQHFDKVRKEKRNP